MTAAGNHAGNVRATVRAPRRATAADRGSSERPRLVRALMPLPSAFVLGAVLALFVVVGESFAETGSIDGMTANVALSLAKWCAFALVLGELASVAFRALDALNDSIARGVRARSHAGSSALPGTHPFALCAVVLAVCWLPFFIVYFPGSLPYDGVRSLNQFVAGAPLENHHPVLMNMLYAVLYQAGTAVGTALGQDLSSALSPDNLGVFAIVSFQTAVCVLVFSGVVRFVDRSNAPAAFTWVTLGFFALFPAWGVFAQDAFKDTLFNGVFALFVLVCGWILLPATRPAVFARSGAERGRGVGGRAAAISGGSGELALWALLFFVGILVCLTRNNGVYLVAPTLLLVCVFARSKQAVAVLVGVLALYVGVTSFLWPAIGVDMKGNSKETLSIPFQQTARYVATHPDDVTDEEHAAIDAVLPYDQLAELYMPDLSDPVKESFKLNNSKIEGSTESRRSTPTRCGTISPRGSPWACAIQGATFRRPLPTRTRTSIPASWSATRFSGRSRGSVWRWAPLTTGRTSPTTSSRKAFARRLPTPSTQRTTCRFSPGCGRRPPTCGDCSGRARTCSMRASSSAARAMEGRAPRERKSCSLRRFWRFHCSCCCSRRSPAR